MSGSPTTASDPVLDYFHDPCGDGIIAHGSCVATRYGAVLIFGPSGSGKSTLASALIARSAKLVADDRTHLRRSPTAIMASPPQAIQGQIELRGVGIVRLPFTIDVPVVLCVNMGAEENERLPEPASMSILGKDIPLLKRVQSPHFPEALMLYLEALGVTNG